MDPSQIILAIAAIRETSRLVVDLATALQAAAGVTDAQIAKAKADAEAAHSELQNTP